MREFFHSRLTLVCYCAIGAFAGWMLRDDRPVEVAMKLNEARDLIVMGVGKQTEALKAYEAKQLDNDGLAGAIESDALPLLRNAVTLTDEAAAAGAKGETFGTLQAFARARKDAAETLSAALRSNDAAKLALAKNLTQEGDRLGMSLGAVAKSQVPRRTAVMHLGR